MYHHASTALKKEYSNSYSKLQTTLTGPCGQDAPHADAMGKSKAKGGATQEMAAGRRKPQATRFASFARSRTMVSLAVLVLSIFVALVLRSGGAFGGAIDVFALWTSAPEPPVPAARKRAAPKHARSKDKPPKRPPVPEASAKSECVDKEERCLAWSTAGECQNNPGYMGNACACACAGKLPAETASPTMMANAGASKKKEIMSLPVDWSEPTLEPSLALAQQEAGARRESAGLSTGQLSCADMPGVDCATLARANLSACGEAEFLLTECPKTCRSCSHQQLIGGLLECRDTKDECAHWASLGECENNRRFMLSGCSRSCNVCQAKRVGCQRRNSVPGLRSPAGLSNTLERALNEYPQFSPTALSRPTSDDEKAPYVLQFEDMISAEEAAAMVSVAGDKLERSLAGDAVSPVRTSTQYWCDDSDGCTSHPTIMNVTRRLMDVVGLPVENAEYFQILRYEKGQFYRVHHDQQTAHWTPQGVRVFTFFVYLSDVEAGGGTKFNDLGVVVTPKLGRAILWPSVLSADLLTGEPKTHHEALPVEAGIKFAANLWIHLYDFVRRLRPRT